MAVSLFELVKIRKYRNKKNESGAYGCGQKCRLEMYIIGVCGDVRLATSCMIVSLNYFLKEDIRAPKCYFSH